MIDTVPPAYLLDAAQASAHALGWDGIGFTRRLDGTCVATALKRVEYGAELPRGTGPTDEAGAASLLRTLRLLG